MTTLRNSTVTTITAITDAFPPAVAHLLTADIEKFPVFEAGVLIDAKLAHEAKRPVLLDLRYSVNTRSYYVRGVTPIDVDAPSRPCVQCDGTMRREDGSPTNGNVPQFVCAACSRRIYLARVPKVSV